VATVTGARLVGGGVRAPAVWVALGLVAASAVLFFPFLEQLAERWRTNPADSHGMLVGPAVFWLIWCQRDRLIVGDRLRPVAAVGLVVAGAVLVFADAANVDAIAYAMIAPITWFVLWITLGWAAARVLALPVLYFTFALPVWAYMTPVLQWITVEAVRLMLGAVGLVAFIQGAFVTVPAGTFEIAYGCAGTNFMVVGLALAVFVVAVERLPLGSALRLLGWAVVVSAISNWLRVAIIIYVGNANGLPAYSVSSNAHYEAIEQQGLDLRDALVMRPQSQVTGLPAAATAGVLTTRAAARAFFVAGTNRAMFRFTLMAHMCRDLEQTMDVTLPTDRIRQDVSRSPGGDSRLFLGNCAGCHTGMDPMAQAFAYYDYELGAGEDEATGRIVYTPGTVRPKYFNNDDTFKQGFRTPDDQWENRWRTGVNQLLGWDATKSGRGAGAKSLGEELASSEAFAQCQVEKVFKNVCLRTPSDVEDRAEVSRIVGVFKARNYSLKRVFAETAAYCKGE